MKGFFKIKVEITNDTGPFPVTETIEITIDNTPEHITTLTNCFQKIAYFLGYDHKTITEYIQGSYE